MPSAPLNYAVEIRKAREKAGLNRHQLARKLGVQWKTVHFWEIGKTKPSLENFFSVLRICDYQPA